jgi:hypothetical protein
MSARTPAVTMAAAKTFFTSFLVTLFITFLIYGAQAAEPTAQIDPGFVPDTGQINPGHAAEPWSAASAMPQDHRPSQEAARAALMMPDNGVPSAGPDHNAAQNDTAGPAGSAPASAASAAPPGPIGATLQTMPAKFSHRNDLLDHVPVTAWPLPLDQQQRQQIYKTVMDDNARPTADAAALKPGSLLSYEQQTHDMRPLPQAVASIDGLQGLECIKDKDKVFLVQPSNESVVDEVTN